MKRLFTITLAGILMFAACPPAQATNPYTQLVHSLRKLCERYGLPSSMGDTVETIFSILLIVIVIAGSIFIASRSDKEQPDTSESDAGTPKKKRKWLSVAIYIGFIILLACILVYIEDGSEQDSGVIDDETTDEIPYDTPEEATDTLLTDSLSIF